MIGARVLYYNVQLPRELEQVEKRENIPLLAQKVRAHLECSDYPVQAFGKLPLGVWYYFADEEIAGNESIAPSKPGEYFIATSKDTKKLDAQGIRWRKIDDVLYRNKGEVVLGQVINAKAK